MGRTESKGYNPGVDPWTIPKSNGFQNQHLTSQCAIAQPVFGLDRFQNLICNLMKMMKPASKKTFGRQESWFVCFIQSFKYTASKQVRRTCSFLPLQGSNFLSFHKLGRAMGNLEVQMGQSHRRVCHLKVATGHDNSNAVRNKSVDPRPVLMVFGACCFFQILSD